MKEQLELIINRLTNIIATQNKEAEITLKINLNTTKRYEEIDVIISKIDYSILDTYMADDRSEKLTISEIPKQMYLTFAIYLSGSMYTECDIMENVKILILQLFKCEEAGRAIARVMCISFINNFDTFRDLIKASQNRIKNNMI